jgi:hypothetical protein
MMSIAESSRLVTVRAMVDLFLFSVSMLLIKQASHLAGIIGATSFPFLLALN